MSDHSDLTKAMKPVVPLLKGIVGELHGIKTELHGLQIAVERANRQREGFARETLAVLSEAKGGGDEPRSE